MLHLRRREARRRYTKASEAGVPEAQFVLGWRYATGQGCEANDELAINLYRKVTPKPETLNPKAGHQPVSQGNAAIFTLRL